MASRAGRWEVFPFLFGGTFIEAFGFEAIQFAERDFPSFSEGLSLRQGRANPNCS